MVFLPVLIHFGPPQIFACGGLKTSFLKVLEHSNSWKYLVLLPKTINSDAKNHRNYLQNGKFSRCARHPTHGSGSLAGRMEAHWFCRWCFHEREKPLLLITKSFLSYWGALVLLLMFSRAGKGASINYKIVVCSIEAHWLCRWCFHERDKALLLITTMRAREHRRRDFLYHDSIFSLVKI